MQDLGSAVLRTRQDARQDAVFLMRLYRFGNRAEPGFAQRVCRYGGT